MTFVEFDVTVNKKRCITAKIVRCGVQMTNADIQQSGWYSTEGDVVQVFPNPSSHLHAMVHAEKKGSSVVWAGFQLNNGDVVYNAFIVNAV